jgi:hypothetical protein
MSQIQLVSSGTVLFWGESDSAGVSHKKIATKRISTGQYADKRAGKAGVTRLAGHFPQRATCPAGRSLAGGCTLAIWVSRR